MTNPPPFNPPAPQANRKVSILLGIGIFLFPLIFAWFTLRKGHSTLAKVISFGWLALSLLIFFVPSHNKVPSSDVSQQVASTVSDTSTQQVESHEEPTPPPQQFINISARQLFAEYEANEVAADRKFKDQLLQVSGTVLKIDSGIGDGANVNLSTGDEYGFNSVIADGDEGFDNQAAEMSKGQSVTLNCTGGGEVMGSPLLRDCSSN